MKTFETPVEGLMMYDLNKNMIDGIEKNNYKNNSSVEDNKTLKDVKKKVLKMINRKSK